MKDARVVFEVLLKESNTQWEQELPPKKKPESLFNVTKVVTYSFFVVTKVVTFSICYSKDIFQRDGARNTSNNPIQMVLRIKVNEANCTEFETLEKGPKSKLETTLEFNKVLFINVDINLFYTLFR